MGCGNPMDGGLVRRMTPPGPNAPVSSIAGPRRAPKTLLHAKTLDGQSVANVATGATLALSSSRIHADIRSPSRALLLPKPWSIRLTVDCGQRNPGRQPAIAAVALVAGGGRVSSAGACTREPPCTVHRPAGAGHAAWSPRPRERQGARGARTGSTRSYSETSRSACRSQL
jgi:hypothetical protein